MQEQLATALIERLNPFLYMIGLFFVFGLVTFGGSLLSLYWKSKEKKDDSISQQLASNTVAIARIEAKLDLYIQQTTKDLNGLGQKIREIRA